MCLYNVLRNNIRITGSNQPFPNGDLNPTPRHQNRHRPLTLTLGYRQDTGYEKVVHVYIARRESGLSVERLSRRNLDPWPRSGGASGWHCNGFLPLVKFMIKTMTLITLPDLGLAYWHHDSQFSIPFINTTSTAYPHTLSDQFGPRVVGKDGNRTSCDRS
jgi:hypothetical protein